MLSTYRQFAQAMTLALLLSPLLPGTTSAGTASDPASFPRALTTIRFNIAPGGYPPYTIIDDKGQVSGIFWDVLQTLANANNLTIEVRQIPTKRVESFMLSDRLDATMRATEWTANPERFLFTTGIIKARDVIFQARNHKFDADSLDDLSHTTLLANLGFHHPLLAERFTSGDINRVDVPDTLTMLRRLVRSEHFDGGIANRRAGEWLIRSHGWSDRFRILPVALDVTDYRLMFTPKWSPLMKTFDRQIKTMRQSGELDAILSRYLPATVDDGLSGT